MSNHKYQLYDIVTIDTDAPFGCEIDFQEKHISFKGRVGMIVKIEKRDNVYNYQLSDGYWYIDSELKSSSLEEIKLSLKAFLDRYHTLGAGYTVPGRKLLQWSTD